MIKQTKGSLLICAIVIISIISAITAMIISQITIAKIDSFCKQKGYDEVLLKDDNYHCIKYDFENGDELSGSITYKQIKQELKGGKQ